MDIQEFFINREIFVTGGTGFLGKSLIEKLLRDAHGLKKIYMLVRPKKGKTAQDRLNDYKNDAVFDCIRKSKPHVLDKLVLIFGDCQHLGLGISKEDFDLMKDVSIIFHGAANVRFDNDLQSSILMNTRGTYELVKLALTMKNIQAFVHISTAYIYPKGSTIGEKVYPLPNDWRKAIKIAETCDNDTLEILRLKYTDFFPNAYSFTKNLSEKIISDYADELPMTILRPVVVSPSYQEPETGFLDNLNGPMGLLLTISMGISQMTYCDGDLNMSMMPVDFTTNLSILSAVKQAQLTMETKKPTLFVRNLAPRAMYTYSLRQSALATVEATQENPLQYTIWAPSVRMTANFYWYLLWVFFVHIPMAVFYDTILVLAKKERMLLKTIRRIHFTSKAVIKFSSKYFDFSNDGMWELYEFQQKIDPSSSFLLRNATRLDYHYIFKGIIRGFKKFILNEPLEATPAVRRRFKIFYFLDHMVKLGFLAFISYLIWNFIN